MNNKDYSLELIYSSSQIKNRVADIGSSISNDFKDRNPIFIGVLKGSIIFLADLIRYVDIDCEVDFVQLKSYDGIESSNKIEIINDVSNNLKNRNVIIVEDIIDTGKTLKFLYKRIKSLKPKSISIVSLLLKPDTAAIKFNVNYIGFEISTHFVVGYGLDYDQKFRNLDSLYHFSKK